MLYKRVKNGKLLQISLREESFSFDITPIDKYAELIITKREIANFNGNNYRVESNAEGVFAVILILAKPNSLNGILFRITASKGCLNGTLFEE